MRDVIGREIRPGYLVGYSVQQGHRPYLKVSRVCEVHEDRVTVLTVMWDGHSTRKVSLRHPEKVAILSEIGANHVQHPVDGLDAVKGSRWNP